MALTVGADPEVFIKGEDGKFVSAWGVIPGTKEQPFKVDCGAVQVDGMALEFNIDPAESEEQFVRNLNVVKGVLSGMAGHEFLDSCTVELSELEMLMAHPESTILGCEPDFNAYTMLPNPRPDAGTLMRTAGGHVHVGVGGGLSFVEAARFTRIMDARLGVYSLLWDDDTKRRELYGRAGAFRPKSYGFEYRSLSNKWIFKDELCAFVFKQTQKAYEDFQQGADPGAMFAEIIDNNAVDHPFFFEDSDVIEVRSLAA